MTTKSLTAMPLSHNDIEKFAQLLEDNFQYRSNQQLSSYKQDYLEDFNLLVGLSFTAIMVRGTFLLNHRCDFNRFLEGYRTSASECHSIKPITLEAAKIIHEAARFFPHLKSFPNFDSIFKKILEKTVKSGLLDKQANKNLSDRLLKALLKNPDYH